MLNKSFIIFTETTYTITGIKRSRDQIAVFYKTVEWLSSNKSFKVIINYNGLDYGLVYNKNCAVSFTHFYLFLMREVRQQTFSIDKCKGCEKKRKNMYIHFDNSPSNSSIAVIEYLKSSLLKQLPHPSYPPNLAPADFGLLETMKETFQDLSFESEVELIDDIENFFKEKQFQF